MPEDDRILFFNEHNDVVAEAYLNETQQDWSTIVFHHEALEEDIHLSLDEVRPMLKQVEAVFINEHYTFDSFAQYYEGMYAAQYTYHEPRYNLPVHGANLSIVFDTVGRLQEVARGETELTIDYPETLISKEEARALLANHQIVKKNIIPEAGWRYGYSTNHYFNGILPNGEIEHIHDLPEMDGAGFEKLPEVEAVANFEDYLLGGRRAEIHHSDENDIAFWQVDIEDIDLAINEDGFIRACRILKTLVGDEYERYFLENLGAMNTLFNSDDMPSEHYRFIYMLEDEDIAFDFFPVAIQVDKATNQILSIEHHVLPYDKIRSATQPTLTLAEANAIAQQHADVTLSLSRDLHDWQRYSLVYLLDYPNSPTGGFLYYVDGDSGKPVFVRTDSE